MKKKIQKLEKNCKFYQKIAKIRNVIKLKTIPLQIKLCSNLSSNPRERSMTTLKKLKNDKKFKKI